MKSFDDNCIFMWSVTLFPSIFTCLIIVKVVVTVNVCHVYQLIG